MCQLHGHMALTPSLSCPGLSRHTPAVTSKHKGSMKHPMGGGIWEEFFACLRPNLGEMVPIPWFKASSKCCPFLWTQELVYKLCIYPHSKGNFIKFQKMKPRSELLSLIPDTIAVNHFEIIAYLSRTSIWVYMLLLASRINVTADSLKKFHWRNF